MIKSITVYNRFHMDLVASNMRKINHKRWNLISISCPDTPTKINTLINEKTESVLKLQGCEKILVLQFDDIRDDQIEVCINNGFKPTLFTKKQAIQVIDFAKELQQDRDNSDLVIHCDAGISRSGAIAKFISDYLKIAFCDTYIHPNRYVMRILWEVIDQLPND